MTLLAVNHHYVEEEGAHPFPAIHPTPPARLAAQIEELGRVFTFVGGDALLAALDGVAPLPERACLITFDDGLRSQAEQALPVLDRLGVPALFFVSPRPHVEGRALDVHKIHWVRAHVAPEHLAERLAHEAPPDADAHAAATYRYDEPASARVKWLLNFGLAPERAAAHVDALFRELVSDEAEWCRRTYLDEAALRELAARGWLGNHGWSHRPLASLAPAAMRDDLDRSRRALCDLTGVETPYVSYPFGGPNAVGEREAATAGALGHRIGFTMERALNRSLARPLQLARIDTNDAPGGKRPLLAFDGDHLVCRAGLRERSEHDVEPAAVDASTVSASS